MELKTGDKVSFLNEEGGGTISKILDNETISVLTEDGFEIPVLKSEVVIDRVWSPDAPTSQKSDEPKTEPQKQEPAKEEETEIYYTDSTDVNIYLAAVPKNRKFLTDDGFDIYLVNDSNYFLHYAFSYNIEDAFNLYTGEAEPNIKIFLSDVPRDKIKSDLEFYFQTIFFDRKAFVPRTPLAKDIKLKAAKLFKEGAYKANDFFDEKAIIVSLLEDNPMNKALEQLKDKTAAKKIIKEKQQADTETKKRKRKRVPGTEQKPYKEVDLHIHNLVDDEAGMTDADKLEYQMDYFRREMDEALKTGKHKKIVFIHGIGGGRLKHELRRELQRTYKSCLFQDASFAEYGYGATLVILRKPV